MLNDIGRNFDEAITLLGQCRQVLPERLILAAQVMRQALSGGKALLVFGNGGSASDAQHITGELVGRFLAERKALKAFALVGNASVTTCIGNDYSYDKIFSRQIEALGSPGDVAVALTTSGNSPNVVLALAAAKKLGLHTIAFTGEGGGQCAPLTDVLLAVPSRSAPRIQEAHAVMYHTLCELVEKAFLDK